MLLKSRLSELRRLEQLVQEFCQAWQANEEPIESNVRSITTEPVVVREEIPEPEQLLTTAATVLEWLSDDVLKQQLESLRSGLAVLQEVDMFFCKAGQHPISLWIKVPADGTAVAKCHP